MNYEAEFKRLEAEIRALRSSYYHYHVELVTDAQALCDNVVRFKAAMDSLEKLEKRATEEGKVPALMEARMLKEELWKTIEAGAEKIHLRISQLPPGVTFLDADYSEERVEKPAANEAEETRAPARRPRP
ncbi:hypothetical protein [Hydrogenophaga sp. 2FB]|uniref:hypothetical protein n=1 Tax=Hydrogenophaga sp. 2FB TaxID=2502187 RepID=UPI0010F54A92|nr:hypothetical protein [Hydrogenophaga sp. 2FB]